MIHIGHTEFQHFFEEMFSLNMASVDTREIMDTCVQNYQDLDLPAVVIVANLIDAGLLTALDDELDSTLQHLSVNDLRCL